LAFHRKILTITATFIYFYKSILYYSQGGAIIDEDYVDEDESSFDSVERDITTTLQIKHEAVQMYYDTKGKWDFYKSFRTRYRTALHPYYIPRWENHLKMGTLDIQTIGLFDS